MDTMHHPSVLSSAPPPHNDSHAGPNNIIKSTDANQALLLPTLVVDNCENFAMDTTLTTDVLD